jgi:formylmethanofuran dehydrogenase subunit B
VADSTSHAFCEGDRVCAVARPGFPHGTIIRIMDAGYVLVRWDGDVLETADHRKLVKVTTDAP